MQLGTALLVCLFLLCIAKTIQVPAQLLEMKLGGIAAATLLLLAAAQFTIPIIPEIQLHTGAVLLCVLCMAWTGRRAGSVAMLKAVCCAVAAGICITAVNRLLHSAVLRAGEPGLLFALVSLLFLYPLRDTPSAAFLSVALAPVLSNLLDTALDLYQYGYALMQVGTATAFDTQVVALLLCGAALCVYTARKQAADAVPEA